MDGFGGQSLLGGGRVLNIPQYLGSVQWRGRAGAGGGGVKKGRDLLIVTL